MCIFQKHICKEKNEWLENMIMESLVRRSAVSVAVCLGWSDLACLTVLALSTTRRTSLWCGVVCVVWAACLSHCVTHRIASGVYCIVYPSFSIRCSMPVHIALPSLSVLLAWLSYDCSVGWPQWALYDLAVSFLGRLLSPCDEYSRNWLCLIQTDWKCVGCRSVLVPM